MMTQKFLGLSVLLLFASTAVSFMPTAQAFAAQATTPAANCEERFLTLPPWYRGLTRGQDCEVSVDAVSGGTKQSDKLRIFIQVLALNIVEIMMQIVAYVCVAFIIIGGFKYITSAGSPDGNVSGRQTIQNALIGLVISMVAIGIINFVAGGLI